MAEKTNILFLFLIGFHLFVLGECRGGKRPLQVLILGNNGVYVKEKGTGLTSYSSQIDEGVDPEQESKY